MGDQYFYLNFNVNNAHKHSKETTRLDFTTFLPKEIILPNFDSYGNMIKWSIALTEFRIRFAEREQFFESNLSKQARDILYIKGGRSSGNHLCQQDRATSNTREGRCGGSVTCCGSAVKNCINRGCYGGEDISKNAMIEGGLHKKEEYTEQEVSTLQNESLFYRNKFPYAVLTDLVSGSYLRGRFLPILRIFHPEEDEASSLLLPFYVPLSTITFNSIRIYFYKEEDLTPLYISEDIQISCTLHLQQNRV